MPSPPFPPVPELPLCSPGLSISLRPPEPRLPPFGETGIHQAVGFAQYSVVPASPPMIQLQLLRGCIPGEPGSVGKVVPLLPGAPADMSI